jgi:orotate phosphoribosyltransferase
MKTLERLVAEKLLKVKAVKLQPANPFIWASGWKSPIYCDNRKTLSYPAIRNFIKLELARVISESYENAEAIAGVATGAIAQGALVADLLGLPFVYIRATPKDHGLENLIEGELRPSSKVVVLEDLVSTGGSSLKAVQAVRNFGCEVIGMVAIFTHGFPIADKNFKEAEVTLTTLSNYDAVIEEAVRTDYITHSDVKTLQEWRKDPANWEPSPVINIAR